MLSQLIMTVKGSLLLLLAARGFAWMLRPEDARWIKGAPTTILIAMFVIGMLGQTVWVVYAALLLMLPLLAKNRAEAAALYVIAGVSVTTLNFKPFLGSIYLMPIDKWVILALGLAIAVKMKPATGAAPGARFDLPFLFLFVLSAVQARDNNFSSTVRELMDPLLTLALPFYLISRSLTRPEDLKRFTLAIAFAAFAMACIAFVESRSGWLIYKQMASGLHLRSMLNGYMKQRAGMLRAPASFPESTSLGLFLAIGLMALLAVRQSFVSRGKWLCAGAVIMLGLLAANSRGAFVGVGIGLLAFDLYRRQFAALASKLAAIGGVYVVLLAMAPFSRLAAGLVGQSADTSSTSDYREMLIRRGMEEIRKHPYIGVSLEKALSHLEDLRQGEGIIDIVNGYIYYGLTAGVGGIILFLLMFVSLCGAMLAARRKLSVDKEAEAIGAFVFSVSTFMIFGSFFTGFGGRNSTPFYEVMALGAALWAVRRNVRAPQSMAKHAATAVRIPDPDILPGFSSPAPAQARARIESPAGAAYRARQKLVANTD